jgi:ABC-type multidrug transport system ATPase subunit
MRITLSDAGKRFNREWIFRHVDYQFFSSNAYAITGPNGSGKSTLLQFIAGAIMPSEGKLSYSTNEGAAVADYYRMLSIAAPYLETIEEMTALEFLQFHEAFKPLMQDMTVGRALERVGLSEARDKQIRYFSSGMKQRIKLAQAFFSDTPVLLLDEPTTNLDAPGITLYHEMIREYTGERILIISSNDRSEYEFCTHKLEMNSLPH